MLNPHMPTFENTKLVHTKYLLVLQQMRVCVSGNFYIYKPMAGKGLKSTHFPVSEVLVCNHHQRLLTMIQSLYP